MLLTLNVLINKLSLFKSDSSYICVEVSSEGVIVRLVCYGVKMSDKEEDLNTFLEQEHSWYNIPLQ